MESLVKAYTNINTLLYNNQANIPLNNQSNVLYVSAGGTLANNTYSWYNGNILFATKTGDSTYKISMSGQYSVSVTNAIATQLTL